MNRVQYWLIVWFILIVLAIVGGFIYCQTQNQQFSLDLSEFLRLVLATGAIISSLSLMIRGFSDRNLISILEFDIATLHLGSVAIIWLSIEEIIGIFQ